MKSRDSASTVIDARRSTFALQTDPPAHQEILNYASLAKSSGTWLASTLTGNERFVEETEHPETLKQRPAIRYLHSLLQSFTIDHNPYVQQASPTRIAFLKRTVEFNRALVRTFAEEGVPIVAGSDSLVAGVVAGFALHDELEALARAGPVTDASGLPSSARLTQGCKAVAIG